MMTEAMIDYFDGDTACEAFVAHSAGSDKRPDDADSWESSLVGAPLRIDPARLRGLAVQDVG